MKKLILILLATVTVPAALLAQDSRDIQTTPFTRKFLHSTNAIDAAQQLGGVGTNGITSLQGTNIVVAIIATNNFVHKDITNGLATTNFVNSVTANMVTNTYNLKAFGAYGDATFVNGVLASSNTPIVTVTLGKFTAGDMGKIIGIFGGGKNRTTFWTGISNVTSSTSIVLSNAVFMSYNATNIDFPDNNVANFSQAGANGYMAVYGAHDDSGAIQSWVNQVT